MFLDTQFSDVEVLLVSISSAFALRRIRQVFDRESSDRIGSPQASSGLRRIDGW